MVDGKSFENFAGMYGISGGDSNSISCFFFLYEECCKRDKFRVTKGLSGTGNQQK